MIIAANGVGGDTLAPGVVLGKVYDLGIHPVDKKFMVVKPRFSFDPVTSIINTVYPAQGKNIVKLV